MITVSITQKSKDVFVAYAKDSFNWGGGGCAIVGGSKEERGNLTQLKRAGLVTTFDSDGAKWVNFTPAGKEYAASLGINLVP